MTNEACAEALFVVRYTAGFNQRYHQICEWWYGILDKLVKVIVGAAAVFGLVSTTLPESELGQWGITISVVSLIAAIALNVFPLGDREKFHGELFHRWTDVRKDADLQLVKVDASPPDGKVKDFICERLTELQARSHDIDSQEPAPYRWLLRRCEGDETESLYGKGIRTREQADAVRRERAANSLTGVAAEVE